MKKRILYFIGILLLSCGLFAQAPEQFKYQAVLRDADGDIIQNEAVTIGISILKSDLSTSVFDETHMVTTNAQGIININIGSNEDLSVVDWSADEYFVEISVNGTLMGTSQLLSVPYALSAKTVEREPVYHYLTHLNYTSKTVDSTWTPLGISRTDSFVFNKQYNDTDIEVTVNARIFGGNFMNSVSGLRFNVWINGEFPDFGNQASILTSNTAEFMSIKSVYTDLPAGEHALQVVGKVFTEGDGFSEDVYIDPAGFRGGILIKESK